MENFLKYIPGFRSDKKWKRIVAIIYYLFCTLMLFAVGIGSFLIIASIPFAMFAIVGIIKNKDKTSIATLIIAIIVFGIGGKLDNSTTPSKTTSTTKEVEVKVKEKTPEEIKKEEAEKAKAEAEAKVIAEKKAIEDKKIADAQAAKDKETARLQAIADKKAAAAAKEKERVAYDTGITYNQLARTPDKYKGKKVKFSGKVIQVMEKDNEVQLRIAVDEDYDRILLVFYDSSIVSSRVLENDNITIKGVSQGIYTYESTMGGNITVPLVQVDKLN